MVMTIVDYTTLISDVDLLNVGPASEIVVSKGRCPLETTIELELRKIQNAGISPGYRALAYTRDWAKWCFSIVDG